MITKRKSEFLLVAWICFDGTDFIMKRRIIDILVVIVFREYNNTPRTITYF